MRGFLTVKESNGLENTRCMVYFYISACDGSLVANPHFWKQKLKNESLSEGKKW